MGPGTGVGISLTGGLFLSSHWVVVSGEPVGVCSALLDPFFKCHRRRSEETSGAAKHKFVYLLTKAVFFPTCGGGAKWALCLFHFLRVLYRNVTQIIDRQISLYPDAKTCL